jgi:hypothetical protein
MPPSTDRAAPVTNELSSQARKRTVRATSSAEAWRAERDVLLEQLGGLVLGRSGHLDLDRVLEAVVHRPGCTLLTRMPREAPSLAAVRMRPTTACLDVA